MHSSYAGLSTDEVLRTLDMVKGDSTSLDIVMYMKSKRSGDIQGESDRVFADNKPRMDLIGYFLATEAPTDMSTGGGTGRRQYAPLRIVRNADAASSSILSAFATNDDVSVDVSVFKAGGDAQTKDAQPMLRIGIKKVRIKTYTMLAGGAFSSGAIEIIDFAFREIELESAPQTNTGKRGGVRMFSDVLEGGS